MATPEKDNCSSSTSSSSHYALHVALQTMKERCQSLQKRLSVLEEENLSLRMAQSSIQPNARSSSPSSSRTERRVSNQTELEVMREKVSELARQKVQLMDHISMVAAENRQLWSRLSKLTKDNQSLGESVGRIREASAVAGSTQNLIRSKTFTKNAPNPRLRERLPREGGDGSSSSCEEVNLDLEDVSLLNKCGFIDSGAGVEMGFLQHDGDDMLLFDVENNPDAKRCTEGLLDIQKELLKQQTVMKVALGKLQINKETCLSCKNRKKDVKPQMVDKVVEVGTDLPKQSFSEDLPLPELPKATGEPGLPAKNVPVLTAETEASTLKYVNILQDKVKADGLDKMCPMCGKIYVKNISFDEFQEHVESHFIDDNELDISLDRTYEYISQTVGNF
ncbi:protein spindle-F [Sabethes cyaneus]|uniref:protein spindle-F n=1 Tax=Sabethes cyaneus TaxID=53552 RepID=UPI00237E5783|nr:protein spindle-F [Sabethes cyaneus]